MFFCIPPFQVLSEIMASFSACKGNIPYIIPHWKHNNLEATGVKFFQFRPHGQQMTGWRPIVSAQLDSKQSANSANDSHCLTAISDWTLGDTQLLIVNSLHSPCVWMILQLVKQWVVAGANRSCILERGNIWSSSNMQRVHRKSKEEQVCRGTMNQHHSVLISEI